MYVKAAYFQSNILPRIKIIYMDNVCRSQTIKKIFSLHDNILYHIGCCNWFDPIDLREFLLNNEDNEKM